ncbi:MAG: energy-coupling factor ABC transporter permease [Rikenellaceae bacterium]|nr:energy-coupling factor ABC transporter permease [Rikenellaceae bacterium]
MHMSDTLISPAVAAVTSLAAVALVAVAVRRIGRADRLATTRLIPLMGVMGALVFAAQMLNFSIPGTGSSGHIVGGVLLAAVLGEWAGFLTLTSVIVVQCLLFADGGLMTLGCNILNMAALSCLVAYPLIFKPLVRGNGSTARWAAASVATSIVALEMGAMGVTIESELSGITALPYGRFLAFMLPIHLLVGLGEGLATAAIVASLRRFRADLLVDATPTKPRPRGAIMAATVVVALVAASVAGSIASSQPDGLEWSVERTTEGAEITDNQTLAHRSASALQRTTALMPDYEASMAGLVGVGATVALVFALTRLVRRR